MITCGTPHPFQAAWYGVNDNNMRELSGSIALSVAPQPSVTQKTTP